MQQQHVNQGWNHPLRYKFYMQVVITLCILGIACYLLLESEENSTKFTVGVSLISAICGYWFPSPSVSRKSVLSSSPYQDRNLILDPNDSDSDDNV